MQRIAYKMPFKEARRIWTIGVIVVVLVATISTHGGAEAVGAGGPEPDIDQAIGGCNGDIVIMVVAMESSCVGGETCFTGGYFAEIHIFVSSSTICSANSAVCSGNVILRITMWGSHNNICSSYGSGPISMCSGNVFIQLVHGPNTEGNRICNGIYNSGNSSMVWTETWIEGPGEARL